MAEIVDSTATYPALPENYFWVRGSQLNDYTIVDYVEVRRKTWWIFSVSVDWYGLSVMNGPVDDYLKAHAEQVAPLIASQRP